jgi:hypothetical protein
MADAATSNLDFDNAALAADARSAQEAKLQDTIAGFLSSYAPEKSSNLTDTLDGRYKVDFSTPLFEYDTKNAKAFQCNDSTGEHPQLYALVCKNGTYQRHAAIEKLKGFESRNMVSLKSSGIIKNPQTDSEHFALIYTRPNGKKLSDLLAGVNERISDSFISRNILSPLIGVVGQLSEIGVSHGSIRADNIYYGEYPVLGECLSEPSGYNQPFYAEPIQRMQAHPAGKGEGNVEHDYYALAVLTVYMLYGVNHFSVHSRETLQKRILKDGAYASLLRGKEPPELFTDLLRGLFSGNINERWNYRNLKQWLDGKWSNIMLPAAPTEALRPFEFAGTSISTRKELAHQLFLNWEQAIELMRTDSLIQWVTLNLRNKELAESLKRIKKIVSESTVKNQIQATEQIMRLIQILDPEGPIRIGSLSFHPDGLDSLCLELSNAQSADELKLLSKYIELSMFSHWTDILRTSPDYVMPESINNIALRIDRLRLFARNVGLGFGNERILYELNPKLACQSPLFANQYIVTLPAMLDRLDKLASNLFRNQDAIDSHIAAYIASQCGIMHEIKLHQLIPHPSLASDKSAMALHFISTAQARGGNIRIPGVAHWLSFRILPVLDIIRSRTLRSRVKSMMVQRAQTGFTQNLAEIIIHSNYAVADMSGYVKAVDTYKNKIERIAFYKKEHVIEDFSDRLGNSMAIFWAYLGFGLIFIQLWMQ